MNTTENTVNISTLMRKDLKSFSSEIEKLEIVYQENILLILKEGNKNPTEFAQKYGKNIGISQRLVVVSGAITRTKNKVFSTLVKNRS